MIASEMQPFSKTGGLADVIGALPLALGRLGHAVTVVTPRYRGVEAGQPVGAVAVERAGYRFDVEFSEVRLGEGARALLADCPPLFDRAGLYNEGNVDYADNPLRYAVLAQAALAWASAQPSPPSVVHAHDWQGGLVPAYLRALPADAPLAGLPTVFTVHNIAYQGVVDKEWVPRLGLDWSGFRAADGFEFWDRLSLLKAGVNMADMVTTVSPTYALEVQRPEYGYGFDGVMRARAEALVGILNGIDTRVWDPAADPHLPAPYDAEDLSGKAAAKRALLERFGLPADEAAMARPIVGVVSRLVEQKGFDLVEAAAGRLLDFDATYVVVGAGEPRYEALWRRMAGHRPDRVGVFIGFDEARAHLVEGGADLFLMPSRYEPCGLNQMYSLRYGTVPVVRAVGGLVDSVRPYNPRNGQGTGFLFSEYHPEALVDALGRALAAWGNPKARARLQRNGMSKDFSWDRSAAEYVTVYKRVIGLRRQRPAKG
ncbi:MAG: glycogen synthase GlgA [Vicinamibacterales bacterium]